jgi:hypothetical protein
MRYNPAIAALGLLATVLATAPSPVLHVGDTPTLIKRASPAYASPYIYIGCYVDLGGDNRVLTIGSANASMTNEFCAAHCAGHPYQYMGTENGNEVIINIISLRYGRC